ncbi:MAG: response regulator [Nitrospiraceae bacterium]|nr:MAG: response regulator [Nitrospiraceae bacterium]
MDKETTSTINILLIEDNPGDVRLMQEMLRDAKVHNCLHVVNDGEGAMSFLRREGTYSGVPQPDLILLDLNLPNKSGREVLREITNDPELKDIPVAVVTSSEDREDIIVSYRLGAKYYFTKPLRFEHLRQIVQSVEEFGFMIVKKGERDQIRDDFSTKSGLKV